MPIVVDKLTGKVYSYKNYTTADIRDFGGAGNGSTDNVAAFNAALSFLSSNGGGELYFPAGVYCFASAPNAVPGGIWLRGTGYDYHTPDTSNPTRPQKMSVLRATASMTRLIQLSPDSTGGSSLSGNTAASLFNLTVDGNGLATDTVKTAGRRNRIMNSEIYGGAANTINIAGQNTTIQGCVVSGEGVGTCINVGAFSDHKIYDNQIRECGPTVGTSACVKISVSKVVVRGNHIWVGSNGGSNQGTLIYIGTGQITGILITGNQLEATLSDQIYINSPSGTGPSQINITGNDFWLPTATATVDNTVSCVYMNGSGTVNQVIFSSNTIIGTDTTHRYAYMVNSGGTSRSRIAIFGNIANNLVAPFNGFTPTAHYANTTYDGTNTVKSENKGRATFSGDGSTTAFNIPHGCFATPGMVQVTPGSTDAMGIFKATVNATNVVVTFSSAPASGTNNVLLNWMASV